jgi:hypothetical protein
VRLFLFCIIFGSSALFAQTNTSLRELKILRSYWVQRLSAAQHAEEKDSYLKAVRGLQIQIAQKIYSKDFKENSSPNQTHCWANQVKNKDEKDGGASVSALYPVAKDKFTEGLALYLREFPQLIKWIDSYSEVEVNSSLQSSMSPSELGLSYLFFDLLKEKSSLTLLKSLNRILTFLESERLFLILRYEGFQDMSAELLFGLQELVGHSLDWSGGVLSDGALLAKLEIYLSNEKKRLYLKEGLNHLFQVLLVELKLRQEKSQLGDLRELLFFSLNQDNSEYQGVLDLKIEDNEDLEISVCALPDMNIGLDAHFETMISMISADSYGGSQFDSSPVLKPWQNFITPDCQLLNKWQTNHQFNCSSDFQEGCDRLFTTICKPAP